VRRAVAIPLQRLRKGLGLASCLAMERRVTAPGAICGGSAGVRFDHRQLVLIVHVNDLLPVCIEVD
jgi:hypothetical protein